MIAGLLLVMVGCAHRPIQPHFAERTCVKGTELWDVPYQGKMVQVCVVVDPVTQQPVLTAPVVMPGVDPYDPDGDKGAKEIAHKPWWKCWQRKRQINDD